MSGVIRGTWFEFQHHNEAEGKLGVLCLAPAEGMGIDDPDKREDAPPPIGALIVEQIEPKGIGALELALRQLREKLGGAIEETMGLRRGQQ